MNTLFIGQSSVYLESVESTNSYAIELLRQNTPIEGTLIYSFEQLKGRGQRGNEWESEANKNIALSLILYPNFLTTETQFLLSKIVSLALSDVMAELLQKPQEIRIKWPNDIYVGDKKIAGILIENFLRENSIQSTVIGIGMNVNQMEFITTNKAVSFAVLEGQEFDLMKIIERVCEHIEARYLQLKANKLESISSYYLLKLYRFNKWSNFSEKGKNFEGKIVGVSENGKLKLELRSNEIKEYGLKEIEFI